MSGNGTWTWTVKADKNNPSFSAISVEIFDDEARYITTGSDKNVWTSGIKGETTGASASPMSDIPAGHTIIITITRNGADFRVTYVDKDLSEIFADFTIKITDATTLPDELKTHVIAQVGTYEIISFEKGKTEINLDQMTNTSTGNKGNQNSNDTISKYNITRKKQGMTAGKVAIIFACGTAGVATVGGGGVAIFTVRRRKLLRLAGKLVE